MVGKERLYSEKRHKGDLMINEEPFIQLSKEDFLEFLDFVMKAADVSWLTTDIETFEWHQINANKDRFLEKLRGLNFKKVFIGVFNPNTKRMEYYKFKIVYDFPIL